VARLHVLSSMERKRTVSDPDTDVSQTIQEHAQAAVQNRVRGVGDPCQKITLSPAARTHTVNKGIGLLPR
jgi:hypothetical protein